MRDSAPHPISSARLRAARENGFLNARCRGREELVRAHGLWCWRMGLPMLWYEPRTAHSRLSRLRLELYTGSGGLTVSAHAELIALSARYVASRNASVTRYDAVWDRLSAADVVEFARAVFRVVRRSAHGERGTGDAGRRRDGRVVPFPVTRSA